MAASTATTTASSPSASEYPSGNRLRELVTRERPQERLGRLGPGALSDIELLALLLRSGTVGHDVLSLSTRLVAEAGSLAGFLSWNEADFRRFKGLGGVKSLQLIAAMEISRRIVGQRAHEAPLLNRGDLVASYFQPLVRGLQVEKFWVLCLNRKNRLLKCIEVTSGTATAALAHPREIYREAIRASAAAVICVHNHPSGDPAPSTADLHVTRQLREAARTLDIELLDHVIVGQAAADPLGLGYYSFRTAGLI